MKTFPAVLAFTVVLAAVSGSEGLLTSTRVYVSNWSTRQIRVTISSAPGDLAFNNRLVEPYTSVYREISARVFPTADIEIWIEGSPSHAWVQVVTDRSIVAFNNGPNIDIYLVKHGKLTVIDDTEPGKLATIYPL